MNPKDEQLTIMINRRNILKDRLTSLQALRTELQNELDQVKQLIWRASNEHAALDRDIYDLEHPIQTVVAPQRPKVSPEEQAVKAINRMSKDQLKALLEKAGIV